MSDSVSKGMATMLTIDDIRTEPQPCARCHGKGIEPTALTPEDPNG